MNYGAPTFWLKIILAVLKHFGGFNLIAKKNSANI